jgi:hypothetical protein
MSEAPLTIIYELTFPDGNKSTFPFRFATQNGALIPRPGFIKPAWTNLTHEQCHHCPLKPKESPECPIAVNIATVVDTFKDLLSYDRSETKVITKERTYLKEGPLQSTLFSVFGLIMATSDCPHTRFLRPLARHHLPFSSATETVTRVLSSFLLGKFLFRSDDEEREKKIHLDLNELETLYHNLTLVNRGILRRIRNLAPGDANVNSITILDSFAQLLQIELQTNLSSMKLKYMDLMNES